MEAAGKSVKVVEHPLDDRKLLLKIFELSKPSFEDLKRYRLVSSFWQQISLYFWRSTATLKLTSDIQTCQLPECSEDICRSSEGIPLSEFLGHVVDPSDPFDLDTIPFSRVKLFRIDVEAEFESLYVPDSEDSEIVNVLPRIWDLIGPMVTYLHCEECSFENTLKMGAFQKLILEKTPFLRSLIMTNTTVLPPSWEQNPHLIIRYDSNYHFRKLELTGDLPMGLGNFLPYVPKIASLKVRNSPATFNSQQRHFFSTVWVPFSNLRKINKQSFRLKHLDCMHTDTFKIFFNPTNQFRATRLPLETLSVDVSPFLDGAMAPPVACSSASSKVRSTEDMIIPMLREHKETLKVFKVFRPPFSEPYGNFPFDLQLEKMEEIHIWGNVTQSFNFLNYMPYLQVVYINTVCYEKWDEIGELLELDFPYEYQPFREDLVQNTGSFQRNFVVQGDYMRELHIEVQLKPESIKTLAEWMPNLKKFRSIFNKEGFQAVCGEMKNQIEELSCLWGSEVDTDTLTGVVQGQPRNDLNITAIKELKRFTLDAYCGKGLLKDGAVYWGLGKICGLFDVRICVSNKMSVAAEMDLKKNVPFVRFIRNYGSGPHGDYECCDRVRFVKDVLRKAPSHHSRNGSDSVFCI